MKLFDAINASPVKAAFRYIAQPPLDDEVNMVLIDGEKVKAFLAMETVAWIRKPLSIAKSYDDWRPAKDRLAPDLEAPDAITQLGDLTT